MVEVELSHGAPVVLVLMLNISGMTVVLFHESVSFTEEKFVGSTATIGRRALVVLVLLEYMLYVVLVMFVPLVTLLELYIAG